MPTTCYPLPHLGLTVVGLCGVAGVFLPFTYDISPQRATGDADLWQLGAPFFLAIFVTLASLRWITSGRLSPIERLIGFALGTMAALVTIRWLVTAFEGNNSLDRTQDWLTLLVPLAIFIGGGGLVLRTSLRKPSTGFGPVMALEIAYLGNASMLLIAFYRDLQLGAYMALVTAVAYCVQIALGLVHNSKPQSESDGRP